MNPNFIKKLKFLFIPFLTISFGFCVIYTFLNWLLVIKLQLLPIKEIFIEFGIPFIFIVIIVIFYFRPKLKILDLKRKNGKSSMDFYLFIIGLTIAIPTIIAQKYIATATGELTQVENVSEITTLKPTKYYKIKRFYIDKTRIGTYTLFEVTGKYGTDFNMDLYVVAPIFDKKNNVSKLSDCKYWLGIKYHKQVSNNLSDSRKESEYELFAKLSEEEFNRKDLNDFKYLEKIGNSDDGDAYRQALENNPKLNSEGATIFISRETPFENKNGDTLLWLIGTFLGGAIIWLIMILIAKFDTKELKHLESGKPTEDKDLKEFIEFIKLRDGFFITPILIYINIAIFLMMFFSGLGFISFNGLDLLNWGANYQPYTTNGEWWRLITSVFLHGGFIHLASNIFGLLFVGIFLEPKLGKTKYLAIYLITGVFASLTSIWWHDATISIGASGAIFALYGLFLSLLLTKVFSPDISKVFLITTLIFIGFNLVMGLMGGIDNAAHIGGLVSGFVIGLFMSRSLKKD